MPSNMLYKYWPARLEGKIKGLNKKIVRASRAQMWLECKRKPWKKLHQNSQGKHKQFHFFVFTAIIGKIEMLAAVKEDFWEAFVLFCLVSSFPSLFYLLTLQTQACRKARMERDQIFWYIYEPDLACLPLSSRVLPLTAELVVKEMRSTVQLFQDQQPDEQISVMPWPWTLGVYCILPLICISVKYKCL